MSFLQQPGTFAVAAGLLFLGLMAWILWTLGSTRKQLRDLGARVARLQHVLDRSASRNAPPPTKPGTDENMSRSGNARVELMDERAYPAPERASAGAGTATEIDASRFETTAPETPIATKASPPEEDDVELPINEAKLAEIPFHEVLAGDRSKKDSGKNRK